jgi:hypothetical protein
MKKLLLTLVLIFSHPVLAVSDTIVNELSEQYVKLVLALGEHDPAYVDAYYGPKEWRVSAKEKKISLKSIDLASSHLVKLAKSLTDQRPMVELRLNYLTVQLSSLNARARMLTGDFKMDFDQQSKALYDTEAPHNKLEDFDKVLAELDQLLPGDQPLAEKANQFNNQFIIPKEKLKQVFDIAIDACRQRTQQFVKLLENENFKLEFVEDKPWSGYNWYQGDAFSLIQVNVEHPIYISRAIDLGCHEGYPGHHTYNALLEANLAKKRGWKEFSVYALFSPQSLIAEGSANYGIEMAFPGQEKMIFERDQLFPIVGIDPKLAESYQKFSNLKAKLNYAGNELARLYLNGKIDKQASVELLQKYTLASAEKAAQRVDFWDTYGAYVINYNWGKDMVKNWVESGPDQSHEGRWKRFAKLLSSPRLPSNLN